MDTDGIEDIVGVEEGMRPGEVEQATLNALVWATGIGVVPLMLMALFFTFRFSMTAKQLLWIQEQIAQRRRRK